MRNEGDSVPLISQFPQEVHHLAIQAGIEAGSRFVQEEETGLASSSRAMETRLRCPPESFLTSSLRRWVISTSSNTSLNTLLDLLVGEVSWQAQFGCIIECML